MAEEVINQNPRGKFKLYFFVVVGLILFVGGATLSGFIIKQQPQILGLSTQSEIESVVSQVGKLIVLPTSELPVLTTVTDVSKVSDQPFFKNVKNDDKLLNYVNAKWAVLYRPLENRIIEVGTYDGGQPAATPTIVPTPSPTPVPSPSPTPIESPSASPSVTPSGSPVSSSEAR